MSIFKFIIPAYLKSFARQHPEKDEMILFPKRKYYPHLNYINTEEFVNGLYAEKYDVIDVRDKTSFNKVRVSSATHIFLKNRFFEDTILDFVKNSEKEIVVYSNNITCSKSYLASSKIIELLEKNNIKKPLFTYDSGIHDMTNNHHDLLFKTVE